MTEPADAPVRIADARARHARQPAALLHRLPVTDAGPGEKALCDAAPRSGWVLDPVWPTKRCQPCETAYAARTEGSRT